MSGPDATGNSATANAPRPPRRQSPLFLRLMLKELRETLRDRRTIATLILMPVLVYPLLSVAFERFLISSLKAVPAHTEPVLGFLNEADSQEFSRYMLRGDAILGPGAGYSPQPPAEGKPAGAKPAGNRINYELVNDLRQSVLDGRVDVAIRVRKHSPTAPGEQKKEN